LITNNRFIKYITKNWEVKTLNLFDSFLIYISVIGMTVSLLTIIFPDFYNYYTNAVNLFSIGLIMVFAGLGEAIKSKFGKRLFLLFGSIWVIYLCLYYFTGFHNPAWGN
jgi:hypothetical protein